MAIVKAKKLSREQRQKESQTAFDIDYQTHNLRIKYFNLASSFLPFTHDKVTRDGVEDYSEMMLEYRLMKSCYNRMGRLTADENLKKEFSEKEKYAKDKEKYYDDLAEGRIIEER